ncbi:MULTISPECIES: glycosyltransferase family 4 protein [Dictyoglomus]|uniref:Glycosyl transferase group 1 n=1 Tax=Dictyoglomus turgidum (strain DSM 6724 / Z-1310) TaxID=515635 RepID=B8DZE0_DICTD|nr:MULTISPECIES: glycosyltransferase family 4 protein [Dictyoglomus]ACK41873.1 glycosyl transferase group 1 [Dictyoglomus turgidum DSM 6724]HBU31273.1 glycosyltransferase WbuB [Dictyoglomus sp.]
MANKNIWLFNHYAITPNLPGGTRHFDFGKELVRRGYKVTIFASSFHYSLLRETKEYEKEKFIIEDYEGVRFVWLKTFSYSGNDWRRVVNMLSYAIRAYEVAQKINTEKPDIIIGSSVHLFAVFTAYLLSKKYKTPFIMEVRDLWPQTLMDMGVSKWHPFVILLGILEKFLYKRADKIIVLLPRANEYIEKLGISPEKIVWIPNGVDFERFQFKNGGSLRDETYTSDEFIVTYTGAIGKANNLDVAVEAAKILQKDYPNIKFLFVGDGPEKGRLLEIVKKEKINNLEFKAPLPKDRIVEIIQKADVLFLALKDSPLYKYGISLNKLFDYLASGKPIIFSSNSINNPVDEAKAGITVPPDNPQALADAIIKLYKMSPEERRAMGLNGRKYVEKYHSIPVLVDKLEKIFEEVGVMKKG